MAQFNPKNFLKLARLLSRNDQSLIEELQTVFDEFEEGETRYEQIGDVSEGIYAVEIKPDTIQDVAWNALENGLLEREMLVDIEVRESPNEVASYIDQLLVDQKSGPNRWDWIPTVLRNDFPHVFLKEVQQEVIGPGQLLVRLEGNYVDHNYKICLIDTSKFEKIENLVQKIGYGKIQKVSDLDIKGVF